MFHTKVKDICSQSILANSFSWQGMVLSCKYDYIHFCTEDTWPGGLCCGCVIQRSQVWVRALMASYGLDPLVRLMNFSFWSSCLKMQKEYLVLGMLVWLTLKWAALQFKQRTYTIGHFTLLEPRIGKASEGVMCSNLQASEL